MPLLSLRDVDRAVNELEWVSGLPESAVRAIMGDNPRDPARRSPSRRVLVSESIRGYGFEGRIAPVTGAAGGGIGEATARRLVREGATVVVTDVHAARTESVVEALRAEARDATVVGFPLDVGDRAGIDRVVAAVREQLGPIDILVNNAAVNVLGPMAGYDPADWDQVINVDLSGCWYLMRATMPGMAEVGRGSIVNISSVASYLGGGGEGAYAAAKAGLQSLTRTAAAEGGPRGIRAKRDRGGNRADAVRQEAPRPSRPGGGPDTAAATRRTRRDRSRRGVARVRRVELRHRGDGQREWRLAHERVTCPRAGRLSLTAEAGAHHN